MDRHAVLFKRTVASRSAHLHEASKSGNELLSGIMERASSRGHEASPQSGLGVGCKRHTSCKKLRGLQVHVRRHSRAQRIGISQSFSVAGVSSFLSTPRSVTGRGTWKCRST